MVNWCIICKEKCDPLGPYKIYHSFPKTKSMLDKWLKATNLKNVSKSTRICSVHFNPGDYVDIKKSNKLKKNAVPVPPPKFPKIRFVTVANDVTPQNPLATAVQPKAKIIHLQKAIKLPTPKILQKHSSDTVQRRPRAIQPRAANGHKLTKILPKPNNSGDALYEPTVQLMRPTLVQPRSDIVQFQGGVGDSGPNLQPPIMLANYSTDPVYEPTLQRMQTIVQSRADIVQFQVAGGPNLQPPMMLPNHSSETVYGSTIQRMPTMVQTRADFVQFQVACGDGGPNLQPSMILPNQSAMYEATMQRMQSIVQPRADIVQLPNIQPSISLPNQSTDVMYESTVQRMQSVMQPRAEIVQLPLGVRDCVPSMQPSMALPNQPTDAIYEPTVQTMQSIVQPRTDILQLPVAVSDCGPNIQQIALPNQSSEAMYESTVQRMQSVVQTRADIVQLPVAVRDCVSNIQPSMTLSNQPADTIYEPTVRTVQSAIQPRANLVQLPAQQPVINKGANLQPSKIVPNHSTDPEHDPLLRRIPRVVIPRIETVKLKKVVKDSPTRSQPPKILPKHTTEPIYEPPVKKKLPVNNTDDYRKVGFKQLNGLARNDFTTEEAWLKYRSIHFHMKARFKSSRQLSIKSKKRRLLIEKLVSEIQPQKKRGRKRKGEIETYSSSLLRSLDNLNPSMSLSTLTNWLSQVELGEPGIQQDVINALASTSSSYSLAPGEKLVYGLIFGEMELKKYDRRRNPYRPQKTENETFEKAIVFMLVCLNRPFKAPVAYYFIRSLNGREKADLLTKILTKLGEKKIEVASITFDGSYENMTAFTILGAKFNSREISFNPSISHPVTKEPVHIFFDACQMLLLVRNCLACYSPFFFVNQKIDWQYIKLLLQLKTKKKLPCKNNLNEKHIFFYPEKMKVFLAAETLSRSVSLALNYCREYLNLDTFFDSDHTSNFLMKFNDMFDLLNTHEKSYSCKTRLPISLENLNSLDSRISDLIKYINNLSVNYSQKIYIDKNVEYPTDINVLYDTDLDEFYFYKEIVTPVLDCPAIKSGFLGFIISLTSLAKLSRQLLVSRKIQYLLSYRTSLNHLELFFTSLQQLNNGFKPIPGEFKSEFKTLLCQKMDDFDFSNSNCTPQDYTKLLIINTEENLTGSDSDNDSLDYIDSPKVKEETDPMEADNHSQCGDGCCDEKLDIVLNKTEIECCCTSVEDNVVIKCEKCNEKW